MAKVEWDESLSVGIGLIDKQHRLLIKHLNDLARAVESRQGPSEIAKTLDFLIDYTDFHFSTEERHMSSSHYPELEQHLRRHEEFKATLGHLGEDFGEEGATHSLAEAIDTLLITWLLNHIKGDDREFGAFLGSQGLDLAE